MNFDLTKMPFIMLEINSTVTTEGVGTHYPNRIFCGALPGSASANDLAEFFKVFGTVLEGKVVLDNNGNSRRFGFVTFATNEDVKRVLSHGVIFFRGKQINVGPAVKRQMPDNQPSVVYSPISGSPSPPLSVNGNQMADVHPFGSRVTPPLSPSLPLASQGVLCRVDQVPHTTVLPNMQVSANQTYVLPCHGMPLQTNVTSLHQPCTTAPIMSHSQIVSQNQMYHPRHSAMCPIKQAVPFSVTSPYPILKLVPPKMACVMQR